MATSNTELINYIANQKAIERNNYKGKKVKRITPEGLEKLCPVCDEWWPQTGEFYSYITTRRHFKSECRTCLASAQAIRRANKKKTELQCFLSRVKMTVIHGQEAPHEDSLHIRAARSGDR